MSLDARSNLLALYRGIAGADDARPLPAPHADMPEDWLEQSASGELMGVKELSRAPTPHALILGRQRLYAWCAFDCMFLPGVLGVSLEVRSVCRVSGTGISLRVSAERLDYVIPGDTVICFVTAHATTVARGLRQLFCRQVRFFDNAEAAASRLSDGATLLTPRLANRLNTIRNRTVFGDILTLDPHQSSKGTAWNSSSSIVTALLTRIPPSTFDLRKNGSQFRAVWTP